MKTFMHLEVVGLFDEERRGKSGFTNKLSTGKEVYKSLNLTPELFQPGTQITIEVAQCPRCERPSMDSVEGICPCGHDWIAWCQDRYKDYEPEPESSEQGQENSN